MRTPSRAGAQRRQLKARNVLRITSASPSEPLRLREPFRVRHRRERGSRATQPRLWPVILRGRIEQVT